MPTKTLQISCRIRLAVLAALGVLSHSVQAQTDDATPFYVGGSLGTTHVGNVYRTSSEPNNDTVVSAGLLGGVDTRLGRQHLTLDGSLQNNRYSSNSELNYRSHSLRGALNWATAGNLSGVLSAKTDRSLADFNASNVVPIFKKNIETNNEYQAIARLGVGKRYSLEGGWTQRSHNFSAEEYSRFVFRQNTGSLGIYVTPAGNVRLGLAARHTKGQNPRYPNGTFALVPDPLDPNSLIPTAITERNDYTRDDVDFTSNWTIGGHSTVTTRISHSRTRNSMDQLRDLSGTTGALGWIWTPTAKFQLNLQYARDTGQESTVGSSELDRVYSSWQIGGNYALTGKVTLNAKASSNHATRNSQAGVAVTDSLDDTRAYTLGVRWAFTRGLSLNCQYDRINRDNSVAAYIYRASSYGCTGQAIFF